MLAAVGVGVAAVANVGPFGNSEVGQTTAQGTLLPSNQWVTPLGTRILDDNARLVSSSISPDGKYLAALGWNNFSGYLTIVNLQTQKIVQQQALATGPSGNQDYSVAADGPLWSPDGSTLWVPQSAYLDRFSFDDSTGQASETASILLCGQPATASACTFGPTNAQGAYLPSGMALSPDGSTLYVALNGANALGVIDTAHEHALQDDPGRQRAAPGRAHRRRPGRLRVQRGRRARSGRASSRTCPTGRRSSPTSRPARRAPARCRSST